MGLKAALLKWLETAEDDEDTPESAGAGEADVTEGDAPDEAEAGDGAENVEEADEDEAGETLPESEVSEGELRDALNTLAAENEALRTRIAELGGDAEVEALEVEYDEAEAEEDEVEQDDDAAQADIDEQSNIIAALRGED